MKIHLSFDHELFFGSSSGSVEKCMIEPAQRLMELAAKHQVPLIFFVDAGFLDASKRYVTDERCNNSYNKVATQIKTIADAGHEIALHVHPHWEDSVFENGKWKINTRRYKLADFSKEEASHIITKYHQALIEITGNKCHSFRAGGWCIQPFEHIKEALKQNELFIDSSVYADGYHDSPTHSFDFRTAPKKEEYRFDTDCCREVNAGMFKEVVITDDVIPPMFYWDLYLRMKLNPTLFKPVGDGSWLKDKKRIYKQFYSYTHHFACADGYFASRLKGILKAKLSLKHERMMVLSHPKSLAECSFKLLDQFIIQAKQNGCTFNTLSGNGA